jgi:FHA domain-containing protein
MRPRTTAFETSGPVPLDVLPPAGLGGGHAGEADATDPEALWAAFCEGAGISLRPPQGLNPALMKIIGQVLAHSIDGTLKLVAVRAAAKQELRADVTMIQARNNNPLKFSPDAGAAIQQLLQPPMRGFMVGPAAVSEVMDDLLGHAIGTMAGMRAALEGVLARFEPSQLEGKLAGNSVLDAVLPMNRRAKLWELYLQHYQRIHDEAQDDFHDLFGKAFIAAYEEQLDRLDAARHPV